MSAHSIDDHLPAWTTKAQGGLWYKGRQWLGVSLGLMVMRQGRCRWTRLSMGRQGPRGTGETLRELCTCVCAGGGVIHGSDSLEVSPRRLALNTHVCAHLWQIQVRGCGQPFHNLSMSLRGLQADSHCSSFLFLSWEDAVSRDLGSSSQLPCSPSSLGP